MFFFHFCFSLVVNEALDIFYVLNNDNESDNAREILKSKQIFIQPSVEFVADETDKDSDKSEDEMQYILNHLLKRILSISGEINHYTDSNSSDNNNNGLGCISTSPPPQKKRINPLITLTGYIRSLAYCFFFPEHT